MTTTPSSTEPSLRAYLDHVTLYGSSPIEPGLSDEAILDLLRTRMRDVDGQVNEITRALQDRTAEAQRLGQEAQRLNTIREYLSREPLMDVGSGQLRLDEATLSPAQLRDLEARLGMRSGAFGDAPESVRNVLCAVTINGQSLDGVTNRDQFQQRADNLSEAIRQTNSGNEQLMVKLQSSMQQRTQTVQMCTNMLKALDDARDAVVGNLR